MWISKTISISFVDNLPQLSTILCTLRRGLSTQNAGLTRKVGKLVALEKMLNKNKRDYKQPIKLKTARVKNSPKMPTNSQRLIQPLLNLYINFPKGNLVGKLLIILFFILPWGLGKHFETIQSFTDGKPLSYLIPTIYLQDIVVFAIVVLEIMSVAKNATTPSLPDLLQRKFREVFWGSNITPRLAFLFLLVAFFSVFFANRFYPSAYFFARLSLYLLFFMLSLNLFCVPSIRRWFFVSIAVNVFLLSALGFLQFYKQASVFNDYLFFGEQPYSVFTPFIAKESFNGVAKIPPYALFLHPNIFAGYLVVSLILSLGYFLTTRRKRSQLVPLTFLILMGSVALFLTRSYTAWTALVLGFLLMFFVRLIKSARLITLASLFLAPVIILLGLAFPFYKDRAVMLLPSDSTTTTLSVERRSALLEASYKMVLQKPFFGWGVNAFTYSFKPFYSFQDRVVFNQPVHNVFALVAAETGLVGAVLFTLTVLYAVALISRHKNPVYSVVLLQILFLASFDHYFFTIPQTQLLFILTLLMGLAYTKDGNCL